MELGYIKADNTELFASLSPPDALDLETVQNYVPLYERFFALTPLNSKNLNLKHPLRLVRLGERQSRLHFQGWVADARSKKRPASVFFKFSPLLDPLRYITGRYDVDDQDLLSLPAPGGKGCHAKSSDPNNSAYVDSFFSYLASGLLQHHGILHALNSYGSFLAVKRDFIVDVCEDMEHLGASEFFAQHEGDKFYFDEAARAQFSRGLGTGRRRTPLALSDSEAPAAMEAVDVAESLQDLEAIFAPALEGAGAPGLELVFAAASDANQTRSGSARQSRTCSSRSSGTEDGAEGRMEQDGAGGSADSCSDADTCSSTPEDALHLVIKRFPVQAIALERCEATLDALMLRKRMSAEEWESAIFQVIATLLAYDKCFRFTHNDLHTNNVMYVHTDKQHLVYKISGHYYRVPTFGRLFKIIDFGRSIYEYRGKRMCSDSFHRKGDAATQYNCEPYMNPKRPRLEPNPSFDLCRLGCSLYDFLMDEYDDPEFRQPAVVEMMVDWCTDDKGRNIMYKSSGEERYPDFKLYKMIARTVHKHTPATALQNQCMERYLVPRSAIGRKARVMNIDTLPCYAVADAAPGAAAAGATAPGAASPTSA
jgi:hypothetical protein